MLQKSTFLLILILGVGLVLSPGVAIANLSIEEGYDEIGENDEVPLATSDLRNNIKLNITSLFVKNFSLQYERILGNKTSLAIGVRWMPNGKPPFKNILSKSFQSEDDVKREFQQTINNTKVGGGAFTPEFRYYLGKSAGKGFYIAPFLRYEALKIKSLYSFSNDKDELRFVDFKGKYSTFGIGLLIGSQFKIINNFYIDWWILGPYFTSPTVKLNATGLNLSDEDYTAFKESIEDIELDFGNVRLETKVSRDAASVRIKGSFAAVRAIGVAVNWRF